MIEFKHKHIDLNGKVVTTTSHEILNEGSLDEVMQEFKRFLLAVGFHPDSIKDYIEDI